MFSWPPRATSPLLPGPTNLSWPHHPTPCPTLCLRLPGDTWPCLLSRQTTVKGRQPQTGYSSTTWLEREATEAPMGHRTQTKSFLQGTKLHFLSHMVVMLCFVNIHQHSHPASFWWQVFNQAHGFLFLQTAQFCFSSQAFSASFMDCLYNWQFWQLGRVFWGNTDSSVSSMGDCHVLLLCSGAYWLPDLKLKETRLADSLEDLHLPWVLGYSSLFQIIRSQGPWALTAP